MTNISRRQLINRTASIAFGTTIFGLPLLAAPPQDKKLKVLVTGGHPDDPETGCGGLIALLTAAGHEVTLAYLTRGEAGIPDTAHGEAAAIRTLEAEKACEILKAKPLFMGQIDGDTYVNQEAFDRTLELLNAEGPDLLLTHWPIDTHKDHRACSMLTYNAWLAMANPPELYFYEVMSGEQSQNFAPTHFVDISSVKPIKQQACLAHKSQQMEIYYVGTHGKMEEFRGMEGGFAHAEAYIRHWRNPKPMTDF
jgi:LmbE family N-acetylglucosaminyl deacetylase